jgi:putative ABC transport system substrate-binding protein
MSLRRRDFITLLGGAAAAWPIAARSQQPPAMPVIGLLSNRAAGEDAHLLAAFRQGLKQSGYVEGQNVAIEYRWADGQYDRLPAMAAELVRHPVAVIAAMAAPTAAAAKAATSKIPIVFESAGDPVAAKLVAGLNRPGGNITGVTTLNSEVAAKRLGLLHDMVPKATRIGILVNPANVSVAETMPRELSDAARALGLQIRIFNTATSREIEAAFESVDQEPTDALFIAPDAFLTSRRVQIAILAARYAIPAAYPVREFAEAGGLMSYGTNVADSYRVVGTYIGRILKGAKPAELPVIQSSKFELVINLATARTLRLTVPGDLLSIADEVIE